MEMLLLLRVLFEGDKGSVDTFYSINHVIISGQVGDLIL